VPVTRERQPGPRVAEAPECPRIPPSLRADIGPPAARDLGGAVARLHDGRYTELPEPRHVVGMEAFGVDHSVAWVEIAVRTSRRLETVEGDAQATIARAVHVA